MTSPTQRTLAWLRKRPDLRVCQIVEQWNPHARVRKDLFGFIDILAIMKDYHPEDPDLAQAWAIQCTSSGVSSRVAKILSDEHWPAAKACRDAGWRILVVGWRKLKPRGTKLARWHERVVEITNERGSVEWVT